LRQFQLDECPLRRLLFVADLVWVKNGGKATELGLDLAFGTRGRDAEESVEVTGYFDIVQRLREGVDQVEAKDDDTDSAVVYRVQRLARLWLATAGRVCEAVVERLQ
jgi:hypothetical protein